MAETGERNIPPRDDLDERAQAQQSVDAAKETELRAGHLRLAYALLSAIAPSSARHGGLTLHWDVVVRNLGSEGQGWEDVDAGDLAMQALALGTAESAVKAAEQRERAILESLKARANMPEPSVPQTEPPK